MGQEDRLKKQIDQLAKALAAMLAKLTGQGAFTNTQEAVAQVNEKLKDELILGLDDIADIPENNFIDTLTNTYGVKQHHLNQLADLLYASAKAQSAQPRSNLLLRRAAIIYQYLKATEKTYALDWDIKIAEINKIV
ncbi:hypothetical protein BEL04_17760 [Mucilaginibacter sp. PPCGB 2223]|uniref:hypothetical protein n=1 Tax=Mucilaginibacter sp. PPCGB 2223 TaxID=1886027 RepID=UPI000826ED71|nr:hypothetical protein [Mucilaginibacter sp. PPCGB 2223]OCX51855.1 hypothetical protein BEL04_17760 [Mucilaginibacter sp. PPCGB 2223]